MGAHWSSSYACSLLVAENEVGKMQPVNSINFAWLNFFMTGKAA